MSVRIQVVVDEREAVRFKAQARKESKSLSAWLRDAGRKMLTENYQRSSLNDVASLKKFFDACNRRETGEESDWEEYKRLIQDSYRAGGRT